MQAAGPPAAAPAAPPAPGHRRHPLPLLARITMHAVDHSEYKRTLYLECWNKLRMWEMTEWDR